MNLDVVEWGVEWVKMFGEQSQGEVDYQRDMTKPHLRCPTVRTLLSFSYNHASIAIATHVRPTYPRYQTFPTYKDFILLNIQQTESDKPTYLHPPRLSKLNQHQAASTSTVYYLLLLISWRHKH